MTDLICFEVNDWHKYPKYFDEWFGHRLHRHSGWKWMPDLDKFAKDNRLCVQTVVVDMAVSMMFTATREWAEKNIPELFEDKWHEDCVYGLGNIVPHEIYGMPSGAYFLDYEEKNFGAIEVMTDDDGNIETIWRVVDGKIIKEICDTKGQKEN